MRKITLALAVLAVAALCIPAVTTAQIDTAALKDIWDTLTPAEQAKYREAMRAQKPILRGAPVPAGSGSDACSGAQDINGCNMTVPFDNNGASTDGLPDPLCDAFGSDQIENDVWYCWTNVNAGDTVTFDTCGATLDTRLAAYGPFTDCDAARAACPPSPAAVCNDDTCGLQSEIIFNTGAAGEAWLIRLGSFSAAGFGTGDANLSCQIPVELQEFSID
jgi:hypothetical protein